MENSAPLPSAPDVLVVGAGLSGLACASALKKAGADVHIMEASDEVGGRVRTDRVDGFQLDRGFQVLLTAYEELNLQVDMKTLELRAFSPGSLVWTGEGLEHLSDPWREPLSALSAMRARVGTMADKLNLARLRNRLLSQSSQSCFQGPDRSTQEELETLGFSSDFIDTFFRPFLGGVFLERGLETSAYLFRYYFRCFSKGDAALPSGGMGQLPKLLAASLAGQITFEAPALSVSATEVTLEGGVTRSAKQVVLAVDGAAASELAGIQAPDFKAAITSYFRMEKAPTNRPLLILDGEGAGPANHVAVLSNVAPEYAPAGSSLVAVSGVHEAAQDPEQFRSKALLQLGRWFGEDVQRWDHLRTYVIPHALPRHPPGSLRVGSRTRPRPDGLVVAGDYTEFGAIQGALKSGRQAAELVMEMIE